jgi:hypothetical protein
MNKNIDFLKVRVNAASVGNDTDPDFGVKPMTMVHYLEHWTKPLQF